MPVWALKKQPTEVLLVLETNYCVLVLELFSLTYNNVENDGDKMLAKISSFFQSLNEPVQVENATISVEMACTVLLCEVMKADGHLDHEEQNTLTQMISEQFSLTDEEVTELISKATELSEHAIDFHQFTSKINSHYSAQEKTQIVTLLWQLAMADGNIASIEEHIIRRIADLLHLSRAEYVRAKDIIKK